MSDSLHPRPLLYTLTLTLNMILTNRDPYYIPSTRDPYYIPSTRDPYYIPSTRGPYYIPSTRDPNPRPNPGSLLWFLVVGVYKYWEMGYKSSYGL